MSVFERYSDTPNIDNACSREHCGSDYDITKRFICCIINCFKMNAKCPVISKH